SRCGPRRFGSSPRTVRYERHTTSRVGDRAVQHRARGCADLRRDRSHRADRRRSPVHTSYGQLAIGLGTISFDIYAAVTVTSWLRDRMANEVWQLVHRLSYVAFAALFLHTVLSGTDLEAPVIAWLTWTAGAAIAYFGLERA